MIKKKYINNLIIKIPNNINISINNNILIINGKLGSISLKYDNILNINFINNEIILKYNLINNKYNYNLLSYIKTIYSIINNNIFGVNFGFTKKLIIIGIGYKFNIYKNILKIVAGFSHDITYLIPLNININVLNDKELSIFGVDKQLVGRVASDIRNFKKPDIYKGKGIRYFDEKVLLKESSKKK